MKRAKFTLRTSLDPLARPGEWITVRASNAELQGILIDAYEIEQPDERGLALFQLVMALEDEEADKLLRVGGARFDA